ncbi:hypothetical protein JW711_01210 [Candidatus Woesearchaeota archaeon]|nr:hypothetical protein [Candidatus Woesearchaeota archaeon]
MKGKPYVGITGFKTKKEIRFANAVFSNNGLPNDEWTAMYGILSSNKRLRDFSSEGARSPALNQVHGLVEEVSKGSLPAMHYYTPDQGSIETDVKRLFSETGIYDDNLCRAVQLNSKWPEPAQVERIMESFNEMSIILQLPRRATEGMHPETIAKKAKEYDSMIRYLLVEPSGGEGRDLDLEKTINLMLVLHEFMPDTLIGLAGGLSEKNAGQVVGYTKMSYTYKFFFDAEGKLRTSDDKGLDLAKVGRYVAKAAYAIAR